MSGLRPGFSLLLASACMKRLLRRWCILLSVMIVFIPHTRAKEYVVPTGDVGVFFAHLPEDATSLVFSEQGPYSSSGDIVLPARPLLIIDGRGCTLKLGPASNGFTCAVNDQKEAIGRLSSRYVIMDFAEIEGGRKAIDLQATLGSRVENVKCVRQTEVAVDLRCCLMAHLTQVLVTNPSGKGIVLRQGDWPGATWANSQSNCSVLDQCRVYCAATTTIAFSVLNSGGVSMRDCVSEGAPCDHDLFLSAVTTGDEAAIAENTVVKSFTLSGLHIEHTSRGASIHVNMPSKCAVTLTNVYWNSPQRAPVIDYFMGQMNLADIGWWSEDFRIRTRISAPRINIEHCHSALEIDERKGRTPTRVGSLELADQLPGNTELKLTYVRVRDRSM